MNLVDWTKVPPWVDSALFQQGIRREDVSEIRFDLHGTKARVDVRLKPKPQTIEVTVVKGG